MYTRHFDLKILPFENVPDPIFFFDKDDYARARKRLTESLRAGRGLIVVIGPIGSGKTTLSQMIQSDIPPETKLIWMAEPPGDSSDLFLFIAEELGLKPSTSERTFVLRDIRNALLKMYSEGGKCFVIIDESHLISDDTINGVRLLNNLEEGPVKLIQLLLLGQPEMMEKISRPEMEPFKQRIATLEILGKMSADRIRDYISHRIQVAGGRLSLFADSAWEAVILPFRSGGTPRIINSMCDHSLAAAYERGKTVVDAEDVLEAAQGMGIGKEIFHYVIDLRHSQTNEQPPATAENVSAKEPGAQTEVPPNEVVNESAITDEPQETGTVPDKTLTDNAQLLRENAGPDIPAPVIIKQEGLKVPILMLLFSIATFIISIFFYCQKTGSDPATCLYTLFF